MPTSCWRNRSKNGNQLPSVPSAGAPARGRAAGRPSLDAAAVPYRPDDAGHGNYDVTSIAKVLGVSRASVYRVLDLPTNPGDRTA